MRIQNEQLTLSGVDMTANITSDAVWLGHIANLSIQLVFTGSPNGVLKLQASCDEQDRSNPKNTVVTNWTDVSGSHITITAAGDHMWTIENAGYTFIRVVWTDSASGVSTITSARYQVKGV